MLILLNYNVTIQDVISTAQNINAGKIILTYAFVESLEHNKGSYKVDNYSLFFLYNEDCTIYLQASEKSNSLIEVAKKYNAIIFTGNINKCLYYKNFFNDYQVVLPEETRNFFTNMNNKFIKFKECNNNSNTQSLKIDTTNCLTSSATDNSLTSTSNKTTNNSISNNSNEEQNVPINSAKNKIMLLPYINKTQRVINFNSLPLTDKIWILDTQGIELYPTKFQPIKLKNGYTVIHGHNSLTNSYFLDAYTVLYDCISGKNIFHMTFSKNMLSCFEPKYKEFAMKLIAGT